MEMEQKTILAELDVYEQEILKIAKEMPDCKRCIEYATHMKVSYTQAYLKLEAMSIKGVMIRLRSGRSTTYTPSSWAIE